MLGDVTFTRETILVSLKNALGEPFDPLKDPLPEELETARIDPEVLGPNRIGRLSVFSNGTISIPKDTTLTASLGGQPGFHGGCHRYRRHAPRAIWIDLRTRRTDANDSPGFGKSLLTLALTAFLDAAGRWVNDSAVPGAPTTRDPLAIDGGTITLGAGAGGLLDLQAGSVLDASAGAHRTADGDIRAGVGGSISVSAAPNADFDPLETTIASTFRAFALQDGGELSITANSLCIAATDCTDEEVGAYWANIDELTRGGFSLLSLASNLGGVSVAPDTTIRPRQVNLLLDRDVTTVRGGALLSSLTATNGSAGSSAQARELGIVGPPSWVRSVHR